MRLDKLLEGCVADAANGAPNHDIAGLTADSRAVAPGMLFAAMPGAKVDGATFIPAAVAAGAVAILCSTEAILPSDLPSAIVVVRADEPRLILARLAARFYPRQPPTVVAVTGTNGKTSVAEFTRQIWERLGHNAASLGTIGVVKRGGAVYGSLTTPDPITLHKTLQDLADEGITHLALEASSHGLDQFRLDGVRLAAGAFNNLGRDHLDYHPNIEAYFAAKMQLFKRLLHPGLPAIICLDTFGNGDDKAATWGQEAAKTATSQGLRVLEIGDKRGAFIDLHQHVVDGFKQRLAIIHDGTHYRIELDLIGKYQASNALVAAAFAIATGANPARVFAALPGLRTVNGRLDVVGRSNGGIALVDYAHKPEALAAALDALRPFATGKLICVFGCGGNRDKGKRPIMGGIAARQADVVIVTDDNPRDENPATVRAEILAGMRGGSAQIDEIGDRAAAIGAAVALLGPGDVLLVAGKGHETGQIVGSQTLPFSDHEQLETAIREARA